MLITNKENEIHFTFYTANNRLASHEVGEGTEFYAKHAGTLLTPPTGDNMKLYPKLVKKTFTIKENGLSDCRPWLGNDSKPGTVSVWSPKEVDVIQRQSII